MSLSSIFIAIFWLIALLNPVFKKYDYGAEFPMLVVFGVLIFVIALLEYRKKREKAYLEQGLLWGFGGLFILSFVFSQTKNVGFSEVLAFTSVIIFYSLFAFKKIAWRDQFLKVIVGGTLAAVVLGFFFYFTEAETRMAGPFFNILYHANVWPNAFALFLLMSWPVFLVEMGTAQVKDFGWKKIGLYFGLILTLTALLLTFSRGALIVFAGQMILLLVYFVRRINLKKILLTILIGLVSFGLFWSANYLRAQKYEIIDVEEKVTFNNEESLTSVSERKDFWTSAIKLAYEKPIFGWGPFSFRYVYNGIQKTFLGNADHPHNIFLKIASENGFLALGVFLAFLIVSFVKVIGRYRSLDQRNKDLVYFLLVSILGALAHNLIDYNFNFMVNLLLLFILMAFVRSTIVKEDAVKMEPVVGRVNVAVSLVIAIFSIYEGSLLTLAYTVDENYLDYSFFPRNHYLNQADKAINEKNYEQGLSALKNQLKLNPLDAQAWYLKGVIECTYWEKQDLQGCKTNMEKALKLNSMNDFIYYRDYLRILDGDEAKALAKTALGLVEIYFDYVENNVHFTAYTPNVEIAAELVEMLKPYVNQQEFQNLLDKKFKMLETADRLRKNKTF